MNDPVQTNRFAPPEALVADLPVEGAVVLGSRSARLGAAMIDGIVATVIAMAVVLPIYGTIFFKTYRYGMMPFLPGITLYYALFLALQGWFLYQSSQTIGKKVVGLRIVRPDGSHADAVRLIGVRTLLIFVITQLPFIGKLFGLIDVLFIFSQSRRCLHDLIADTVVVTAESSTNATLDVVRGLR